MRAVKIKARLNISIYRLFIKMLAKEAHMHDNMHEPQLTRWSAQKCKVGGYLRLPISGEMI